MKKERVLYLDLIRIVGYFMITSYHFSVAVRTLGIEAAYIDIFQGINHIVWAPIAVSCFFMVSGAALIFRYEDNFSLKDYYKKRFLGIFPLFWLAYLFVFLDYFYRSKSMPNAPKVNFLLTVIGMDGYLYEYIDNFYMIGEWFLGIIIILYIVFPLYKIVMCKCKYILPVVFLAGSIWLLYNNPFDMMLEKNPIVCSMYFVMGMLFEMIRKSFPQKVVVIGRRILAVMGVGLYIMVYLVEQSGYFFNAYHVVFMLAISLYMIIMEVSTWIKSVRVQKLVAAIGKHSFAYYLLHHVFLYRYLPNFAGAAMSGSNTLLLFVSAVGYIYLLAVGLDKVYAYLAEALRRWHAQKPEKVK